ncbi:MAG: response regulator [Byssovorax sp.]
MTPRIVLVIEDNPLTRKIVRLTLGNEGFAVVEASDAASAIESVERTPPDLILQDLLLPDMDGFELVGRLRALRAVAGVPIIAFSGFLSRLEYGRAAGVGFTDFLPKPVEPSRLVQVIRSYLPADPPRQQNVGAGRRILVVDDDPVQLKLARIRLAQMGFEVAIATNGAEALEVLRRGGIEAVLSDVMMPHVDGFRLCAEIRRDAALAQIPVILVSSNYVEEADRRVARTMGARAFVVRTPDLASAIEALNEALEEPERPSAFVLPDARISAEYHDRVLCQLERQAAMNAAFAHRSSMHASMLSVVAGISEALVRRQGLEGALPGLLTSLLEACGLSKGALFLAGASAADDLALSAGVGFLDGQAADLQAFFGERAVLDQAIAARAPLVLGSATDDTVSHHDLLARAGAQSALLIPFVPEEECLGIVLLLSSTRNLTENDWIPFARVIAVQIGQGLALSRTVSKLAASESRYRALLEGATDSIFTLDSDGRFLELNAATERFLGRDRAALTGARLRDFMARGDGDRLGSALVLLRETGVVQHEWRFSRPDGTVVTSEASGSLVQVDGAEVVLGILRDVTDRKRTEQALQTTENQLRQAQKMEAVGRLAGGIAHDFNNLLSVILTYDEMILDELKPGDPLREYVDESRQAATRAADLTRQLLMFSRQHVLAPKVVDLDEVLFNMHRMLQRILGEDVELVAGATPSLGRIRVDPSSIEQVIMNLVVNARDAMPTGGKLTIETGNVVLDEGFAREHPGVTPGPHVMLSVTDTGVGMDKATQSRIFEPFFTTKDREKGTGLGLSTAFGIVQQSRGTIWVYSELGKGTSFKVYLPRVDALVDRPPSPESLTRLRGSETILLVEDEDQVRAVARSILRKHGYQVLEARNAGEALLICEAHAEPIDLLLTDVVMPQMSGPALAKRLLEVRPGMKVLCMSGYTDDSIVRHGVLEAEMEYLQKPFTPQTLTKRVREVLDVHEPFAGKGPIRALTSQLRPS